MVNLFNSLRSKGRIFSPFTLVLLSGLLLTISACSRKMVSGTQDNNLVIYPAPPDTTRLQFLTRYSVSADIIGKKGGFKRFILGKQDERKIGKPYGIAIHKGKIYICDTFKKGLDILDLEKNSFTEFVPEGLGALKLPMSCAVDSAGFLFVADPERHQVVIFDQNGKYYSSLGEGTNFKPTDVFLHGGKIWVCDLNGKKINAYDYAPPHALLAQFPSADASGAAKLYSPTNVVITDSNMYVTDFGDFKVKKYSRLTGRVDTVGTYGSGQGQFARPKGIAVSKESNLYVVDAGFENVQIFNDKQQFLMFFGGPYKGPGDMWLPVKVVVDYDNLKYFQKYVNPAFDMKYLVLVTNQFGPDKVNVYGFVTPKNENEQIANRKK